MSFYHPELLYGLFAIIIPIIIHLFNFKRFKKVYFTNVRFLRNIQQQSKRHSQWRHLLVLIIRIFIIAFLVFAFARPYIPLNNQTQKDLSASTYVNVFLDNSFSMQAESTEGNLLEEGRKKAREVALAYEASDNFKLILNNKIPESNRFLNRDEFLDLLDEVYIDPASEPFSKIIDRVQASSVESKDIKQELYIISDFQQSQADIISWNIDSNSQIQLLPIVSASQNNVFVDSCWFYSPILQKGTQLKIGYRIKNLSENNVEKLAVSLLINGQQRALGSIDIKANETKMEELVFRMDSVGVYHGEILIQDFPVVYDDQFYFNFSIDSKIDILCISSKKSSSAISKLYSGDSLFNFVEQDESRIDFSSFSKHQVIIINGLDSYSSGLLIELKKYMKKGSTIMIIPPLDVNIEEQNSLSQSLNIELAHSVDTANARIHWMDIESQEFDNVFDIDAKSFQLPDNIDLPHFRKHLVVSTVNKSGFFDLIKFDNGDAFLRKYQINGANVYLFTAPVNPENGNYASHALFVPIMYNTAMQSKNYGDLYYILGKESIISLDKSQGNEPLAYEITSLNQDFSVMPSSIRSNGSHYLVVEDHLIENAGNYNIINNQKVIHTVAFNYPRLESDLRVWTEEDIVRQLEENPSENINIINAKTDLLSATIKDLNKGVQLWKLFLSLAFMFLIIELFLLRFLK